MDKVSTDDWIIGGVTLLLIIDLLFLPWFSITVGFGPVSVTATSTATGSPDGWLGVLAVISAILLLVDLGIERFSPQTQLPMIGGSREQTRFVLAGATALFVGLKFLFHIHFSLFGFGFWAAVVLTAILLFATIRAAQGHSVVPTGS
jgi:hypothetical protein